MWVAKLCSKRKMRTFHVDPSVSQWGFTSGSVDSALAATRMVEIITELFPDVIADVSTTPNGAGVEDVSEYVAATWALALP